MLWAAAMLTLITGWDYLMAGLRHVVPSLATAPEVKTEARLGPAVPGVERAKTASVRPDPVPH
jgi:hypothetical protein